MSKRICWVFALTLFLALNSPPLLRADEASEGKALEAAKKWLTLADRGENGKS